MKVLFDHQCYWERFGGVSRYFTEILKTNSSDIDYELALKYSNNEYLSEIGFRCKPFLKNLEIPKKQYFISMVNKPNSIQHVKNSSAQIVHLTHYDPYLLKWCKQKTVVSTIHDLNFFAIPQFYRKHANILKTWQETCVKKSDWIVTISLNSKNDLIKYLKVPENRISVIYHGISDIFKKTKEKSIIERPYILFVGRRAGYKNFSIMLDAFSNIKQRYKELALVCTGQSFSESELKVFNTLGLADDIIHISASDEILVNLYSNARLFVFPSYYEGFGFPLLEAMACECPVICSNSSCFPEIAGDAGLYFNPNDSNELTEKIEGIMESVTLRNDLIKKGIEQKNKFSWDLSRKKHLELYKDLAAQK